jgi:hypothetical protein
MPRFKEVIKFNEIVKCPLLTVASPVSAMDEWFFRKDQRSIKAMEVNKNTTLT